MLKSVNLQVQEYTAMPNMAVSSNTQDIAVQYRQLN